MTATLSAVPVVTGGGWRGRLYLRLLRLAARSGRIRRASIVLGHVAPRDRTLLVDVARGRAQLEVRVRDPYWSRTLVGWEHEPDVRRVLYAAAARHPGALFVDGGANVGYWSARLAPPLDVVAVEAVPPTFAQLERNAARNGFRAVPRALWSAAGETVRVGWRANLEAGAGVRDSDASGASHAEVPTTTVDELCAERTGPVIVKLDVEGAESACLDGAAATLARALIVIEDHGSDPSHTVTRDLLRRGLVVRRVAGDALVAVRDASDLDAVKTDPSYGYNVVAVHPDGPWASFTLTGGPA